MVSEPVAAGPGVRRAAPPTKRGERTRSALITAAREVFERDGYLDAKIADISRAAGTAAGSFYNYFDGKYEIFAALVEQVGEEMVHPHIRQRTGITDPGALIEAANREYLLAYRRNARLMAVFEEVAQINEDFRRLRVERGHAFAQRNAAMIRELQESGRAGAELDPMIAAHALGMMVSRMANAVFVQGVPIDFEELVANLTRLWVDALRLKPE